MLDARTGALLGKLSVEWPDGLAIDPRSGDLLILHAGPKRADGSYVGVGHVDVRDGRTGHLMRTIGVGVAPVALAVDRQTGQALVVNAGGMVRVADSWGWLPLAVRQRLPLLPPSPGPTRT